MGAAGAAGGRGRGLVGGHREGEGVPGRIRGVVEGRRQHDVGRLVDKIERRRNEGCPTAGDPSREGVEPGRLPQSSRLPLERTHRGCLTHEDLSRDKKSKKKRFMKSGRMVNSVERPLALPLANDRTPAVVNLPGLRWLPSRSQTCGEIRYTLRMSHLLRPRNPRVPGCHSD